MSKKKTAPKRIPKAVALERFERALLVALSTPAENARKKKARKKSQKKRVR